MASKRNTRHAIPPDVRRAPGHQGENAGLAPVNSGVKSEALARRSGGPGNGGMNAEFSQVVVAPLSMLLILDTAGAFA